MKRLFIAITPVFSDRIIQEFYTIKSQFKNSKIKWVDFKNFHLTLKFLGNTDESLLPEISNKLTDISKKFSAFNIRFKGYGIFGNVKFPKILWAGIEKNYNLFALQQEIEFETEQIGFERDSKKYAPHLTLGRVKFMADKKELVRLITNRATEDIANVNVKKFQLIESKLQRKGPLYTTLSEFFLKKL